MPYKDKDKQKQAMQKARKKYEEEKRENRYRCWSLLFYPDSAPTDWADKLSELHLQIWVSPLHDKDVWNKADEQRNPIHKAGEPKKAHWHLVVEYPNPVSLTAVFNDFECLNGSKMIERVRDKVPMVRYLTHKDDVNKAQYSPSDIILFGGADLDIFEQLGRAERHAELRAMRRYIVDNGVIDFFAFCLYCDDCMEQWSRLLDDNSAYIIERFIKSYRASLRDIPRIAVNPQTGEVIE